MDLGSYDLSLFYTGTDRIGVGGNSVFLCFWSIFF